MSGKRGYGDPSNRGMPSELDEGTADANVLAEQLGELARSLQSNRDTEELLDEVVPGSGPVDPGGGRGVDQCGQGPAGGVVAASDR